MKTNIKSKWASLIVSCVMMVACPIVHAQEQEHSLRHDEDIPPALKPWIPWVLADLGDEACPDFNGTYSCAWPGSLQLHLDQRGGDFQQDVVMSTRAWHVLPGQHGAWPNGVTIDGKPWPVVEREQHPAVELAAGRHDIRGSFSWERVPETLHVGQHTAFLSLHLGGKNIPLIKRESGNIWLKGLSDTLDPKQAPEQVELQVFRQLRDGLPLIVETLLTFQVSGRARELALPKALLADTVPLSVDGDLAIALEADGTLRVQLEPGKHEVRLLARTNGLPDLIKNQPRPRPWPEQEYWTYRPNTELRAVDVTGAPSIDASRTGLPEAWRSDGVYVVGPADALRLTTTRRAQEQLPDNRLQLDREYWLDESAKYFTVRDTLTGEMHQNWRLNLLSGELGQAQLAGEGQVITLFGSPPARGVEVRDNQLSLVAVSRLPKTTRLPAVGWSEDVERLTTTLRLPPGWQLFTATGVDDAQDTWVARWDLFSVFYVLLLTLAVSRLVHVGAGAIAAGALILSHGEVDSPEFIWLPLVAFGALLVLVEPGRFQRVLRLGFYATAIVLWIVFLPFCVNQVRSAIYPHLTSNYEAAFSFDQPAMKAPALEEPVAQQLDAKREAADIPEEESSANKEGGSGARPSSSIPRMKIGSYGGGGLGRGADNYPPKAGLDSLSQKQFKPDAVVQSGPGIPEMVGPSWHLNWSGPVAKDHQLSLYLISPNLNRVLTALRLLFLGALAWLIWRRVHRPRSPTHRSDSSVSRAAAVAALALGVFVLPSSARADEPSDERLTQLKERLRRAPSCAPQCISANALNVELGQELVVVAKVHAAARGSYKLPGPASALHSVRLTQDGRPLGAVRLEADGSYYALLEKGVHTIELRAGLTSDRTTLDVGTTPERVSVRAEGWTVSGIDELGRVDGGTLTLQRLAEELPAAATDSAPLKSQVAVPPTFAIRRSVNLTVTGQVITQVERLSDASRPEVLRLQLLPSERLTTPGIEVSGGLALLPFPAEARSKVLTSTLPLPSGDVPFNVTLIAPPPGSTTETWDVQCGVVWHCDPNGITPTAHQSEGHSLWTFHPWPGEKLTLTATSPTAADGAFLTIQHATLTFNPGIRLTRAQLQMSIQTSRAVVHAVNIPADAKLDTVQVDGVAQAVKIDQGRVRFSLSPGVRQVNISWQQNQGLSALFRTPSVNLGAAGVNFRTIIDLPEKRWLLLAGGPAQGPAILVWGYLLLIVSAALVLSRLPYAPLSLGQWLLLGLGLTQVPSAAALAVAGWFFVVGSRHKWPMLTGFRHNFVQLMLVGYTLGFLMVMTGAVYEGLVGSPDMDVSGAGSYGTHLVWFSDRSNGTFAPAWCLNLTIWIWRGFMLAWALWLSRALLGWLKWAWTALTRDKFWAPKIKKNKTTRDPGDVEPAAPAAAHPTPPDEPAL